MNPLSNIDYLHSTDTNNKHEKSIFAHLYTDVYRTRLNDEQKQQNQSTARCQHLRFCFVLTSRYEALLNYNAHMVNVSCVQFSQTKRKKLS